MDAIETIEYKKHTIEIFPDENPESPREWDNLTTFHCWHKRMNLGDENYYLDKDTEEKRLKDALEEAKTKGDIILRLYAYQHSGISLSLSQTGQYADRWDAGQVGFVIVSRKKIIDNFGEKNITEKAYDVADQEVKTYNQYLCGDVYGYVVDEDGDSCWEFYETEDAIAEAKSIIDCIVEENKKKHIDKLKGQIKNKAPLSARKPMQI